MTTKPAEATPAPKPVKAQTYVKGSHAARVRAEHDERRTDLLALRDVLCAQRDALNDQIEDIGNALTLLSEPAPAAAHANVVSINSAAE